MRLTPAQFAVHLICGEDAVPWNDLSLVEQLTQGHQELCLITGQDFEFDLQRWHDYLKESRDGGYTWNRSIDLPKIMQRALENPEWHETVKAIRNAG